MMNQTLINNFEYKKSTKWQQDLSRKTNDVYQLVNGEPQKVGEENVYESIQEAAKGCTLAEILTKYNNGELLPYTDVGEDVDMTQLPKDIIEQQAIKVNALNAWNKLDPNLKALFNNDMEAFAKASTNDIVNALNKVTTNKEVSKEENN